MIATRGIQWRIALSYVTLLALVMLALGVYLVRFLHEAEFRNLEAQLAREANVVAADAAYRLSAGGSESLDPFAKQIGSVAQLRVTIIGLDGQVLGDSDADPALTENHGARPEVVDALQYGIGETQRHSATIDRDLLYLAVPIQDGDQVVGVARVALPSALLEASINRVVLAVAAALVVAAGLAVAIAMAIARAIARPIQALTVSAQRLAHGLPHQPLPVDAGGEVGELAAAFDDMAARIREHVQSVELQRARLAAVLANIPDGVVMLDGRGTVAMMNATAERLLGVNSDGAHGRSLIELTKDHELADLGLRAVRDRVATSPTLIERGSGQQRRSIQSMAVPLPAQAASTAAALVVLQDVTQLRQAEMTRRDFVANVSHELRTPVASVKAMVETLEEGALDDDAIARDFLARIHVEVDGLTRLIEELLELSRIESGRVQLQQTPHDLRETVSNVIQRLQPQAERQGVTLSAAPSDEPAVASIDDERIQQVLMNLVHNAIKVTDPGGEVLVSTQTPDDRVQIIIQDNGLGIERQELGRLFERFYKVDKSRSSGGTGLGLAIAKHLTQAHGGRIWAESAGRGQGATFTVELPAASSTPARKQVATAG